MQETGDPGDPEEAIWAAERVRDRYRAVWAELHDEPVLHGSDRQAIRARVRRLNELGYSVELDVDPAMPDGLVRLRMHVTTRRFHAREMERRTRIRALEGQARLLLNDLNEYHAWIECQEGRIIDPGTAAERWLREVYRPTLARIAGTVGPARDLVQAYCDVLEQKWYLSEAAGADVGLERAIQAYIELGAPAPEGAASDNDPTVALDLERIAAADRLGQ